MESAGGALLPPSPLVDWWSRCKLDIDYQHHRSPPAFPLPVVGFTCCARSLSTASMASRTEDPGFNSRDFVGSSPTSDLKIGTPVATLPGSWRYRVSAGTGRSGVSIL